MPSDESHWLCHFTKMNDGGVLTRVVHGSVLVVSINRPFARNAVNGDTAKLLYDAFVAFDKTEVLRVAVLTGLGGSFCAGADLTSMSNPMVPMEDELTIGPMGPSRLALSKPVIAAVEGFCVAGGLELACWCDMRVASSSAVFGVFCRKWGVPLIDGGTARLPLLVGMSRAMDMILTGRAVTAAEALDWGLVNRIVEPERALDAAVALAVQIASNPQPTMRADRRNAYEGVGKSIATRLKDEFEHGSTTLSVALAGADAFAASKRKSKL